MKSFAGYSEVHEDIRALCDCSLHSQLPKQLQHCGNTSGKVEMMWVLFHTDCHTKRLWNTTCSPPAHQVHISVFIGRWASYRTRSQFSKSPPLPAVMLWLCGFRPQTVNKRWMQFPAVQNKASAFFWMSSRGRLLWLSVILWPSSLIIWSWWVHGLSRCFQVSLNTTQCWLFCS